MKRNKSKTLKLQINNDSIYANTIYANNNNNSNIDYDAIIPLCVLEINERSENIDEEPKEKIEFYEPEPGTTNDLTIGSLVEVMNDVSDEPLYGVIRWMGIESGMNFVLAGVELEEEQSYLPLTLTDGVYKGYRFFDCSNNRALFVPLNQCHKDSRFQDGTPTPVHNVTEKMFGKVTIYCSRSHLYLKYGVLF